MRFSTASAKKTANLLNVLDLFLVVYFICAWFDCNFNQHLCVYVFHDGALCNVRQLHCAFIAEFNLLLNIDELLLNINDIGWQFVFTAAECSRRARMLCSLSIYYVCRVNIVVVLLCLLLTFCSSDFSCMSTFYTTRGFKYCILFLYTCILHITKMVSASVTFTNYET